VKRATRRSAVNVYEVLAAGSLCWSAFAAERPVPGCGCDHHAFERGDPVTVPGVNVPARFRRFGRGVAVTVYPDGRMVPAQGDADGRTATDGA
jgi:hypothetical protein